MLQKIFRKKRRKINPLNIAMFLFFIFSQIVFIRAADQSDFEEILRPLRTIYDMVKYTATVIAGLVLLFAGITYIMSGSEPGKREKAKNMVTYVIIGLIVIWATPFVVDLVLGD